MNILSCNKNTSFYGTYKGTVKINELNTNSIESRDAYVVQMDPKDKKDLKVLKKLSSSWKNAELSGAIYKKALTSSKKEIINLNSKFFVITIQDKDFDKINHKEVLAQAQLGYEDSYKNQVWIDYLQVNPNNKYGSKKRKFANVGKAFVDFFKEEHKGKKLVLAPLEPSLSFHEKQNFKYSPEECLMEYQA